MRKTHGLYIAIKYHKMKKIQKLNLRALLKQVSIYKFLVGDYHLSWLQREIVMRGTFVIVCDCILYVFATCCTCECDVVFLKEAYCIVLTCIEHVEKFHIVNACLRYLFPRVETRDDCNLTYLTYCLAKVKFGIL